MTAAEIAERVETIRAAKGDEEAAHGMEDALHQDVLAYIAERGPVPWNDLARGALRTREIAFDRWYA